MSTIVVATTINGGEKNTLERERSSQEQLIYEKKSEEKNMKRNFVNAFSLWSSLRFSSQK